MQAKVKTTVDSIMLAIGPIFHDVKDYETIRLAMVVVMSKVIQATPYRGMEMQVFDATSNDILHALEQLLKIEEVERAKLAEKIDRGINGFENLVEAGPVTILSESGPALVGEVVAFDPAFASKEETEAFIETVKPTSEDINDVRSAQEKAQEDSKES